MKVVSTVSLSRFDKYGVHLPERYEVTYVTVPYTDEQLIEAAHDADVLFVGSIDRVSRHVIEACRSLKMIHTEGVSFDKVDVAAAKECGIPVCNNRAVNASAVAEHCVGLMLAGLRHIARVDRQIRTIGYGVTKQQSLAEGVREMASQEVGLIGMGVIGREVVKRLQAWGCKLRYYDVVRMPEDVEKDLHIEYADFDTIISASDIISVHVPVIPSTLRMLGKAQFDRMKATALVINISRGEIIDNMALAEALENGKIFGAALDTVDPEPLPTWHPLLHLSQEAADRLTLTPHIAGMTDDAFVRMLQWAIANMERLENGAALVNVVNG